MSLSAATEPASEAWRTRGDRPPLRPADRSTRTADDERLFFDDLNDIAFRASSLRSLRSSADYQIRHMKNAGATCCRICMTSFRSSGIPSLGRGAGLLAFLCATGFGGGSTTARVRLVDDTPRRVDRLDYRKSAAPRPVELPPKTCARTVASRPAASTVGRTRFKVPDASALLTCCT
jgi:hypothetical protein